jgi:apolipoprotein N-acyltransferase
MSLSIQDAGSVTNVCVDRRTVISRCKMATNFDAVASIRDKSRRASVGLLTVAVGLLFADIWEWQDVLVFCGFPVFVGHRRRIRAMGVVSLYTISFPPFYVPAWWICLRPMIWMWRDESLELPLYRVVSEATVISAASCWLTTGFIREGLPSLGWLLQAVGCFVFSLQFLAIAVVIRLCRRQSVVIAAALSAVTAVSGELLEAWLGISWSVSNMALTVGGTPLAQWSRWITPFGVAGILYFVNFLLVLENSTSTVRRWCGPLVGVGVLASAWCGGELISANTSIAPLPFSVLLVQPHLKVADKEPWRPWLSLDHLTNAALLERQNVDLIVWPESCLTESWCDDQQGGTSDISVQLTVQDFSRRLTPGYKTNCLVGVVMNERGTTQRYGLEVVEVRRYNCGCLVSKSGEIFRHEKLDLVPFKEGLPGILDTEWIRNRVLPGLQLNRQLHYGRRYAPLSFTDSDGDQHSIAVSVCYESFLPWLPQYRESANADAIVHILYDGNTAAHPGLIQRQILACQLRAIETRKWNLVCSTWTGTAIIDPTGKIVRQLPPVADVLRTDM